MLNPHNPTPPILSSTTLYHPTQRLHSTLDLSWLPDSRQISVRSWHRRRSHSPTGQGVERLSDRPGNPGLGEDTPSHTRIRWRLRSSPRILRSSHRKEINAANTLADRHVHSSISELHRMNTF